MYISFIGHHILPYPSDFIEKEITNTIKSFADKTNETLSLLCGGYGGFDEIALFCGHKLKQCNNNIRLVFVTPYIDEKYLKSKLLDEDRYDEIIYPEEYIKIPKFAISQRNKYMIDKSDYIIAYVNPLLPGNAIKSLEYAKRQNKTIKNIFH